MNLVFPSRTSLALFLDERNFVKHNKPFISTDLASELRFFYAFQIPLWNECGNIYTSHRMYLHSAHFSILVASTNTIKSPKCGEKEAKNLMKNDKINVANGKFDNWSCWIFHQAKRKTHRRTKIPCEFLRKIIWIWLAVYHSVCIMLLRQSVLFLKSKSFT